MLARFCSFVLLFHESIITSPAWRLKRPRLLVLLPFTVLSCASSSPVSPPVLSVCAFYCASRTPVPLYLDALLHLHCASVRCASLRCASLRILCCAAAPLSASLCCPFLCAYLLCLFCSPAPLLFLCSRSAAILVLSFAALHCASTVLHAPYVHSTCVLCTCSPCVLSVRAPLFFVSTVGARFSVSSFPCF